MSTTAKSKIVDLFTILVIVLTAFQGLIPTMPVSDPTTIKYISAITLFLVSGFTYWKQTLSIEIANSSRLPTIIMTVVATLGAANEMFDFINFTNLTGQWVRFGVTFLIMGLNLASKMLWPTAETKSSV